MDMQDSCQLWNHLWLHRDRKNPDAGKDWGQEEKEATEDEMVGWHHWLNRHEFEQTREIVKGREAWWVAVHGVAKSWTWLSDWTTATTAADSDQIFCPQTCIDLSVSQINKMKHIFSPPCYFLNSQPVAVFLKMSDRTEDPSDDWESLKQLISAIFSSEITAQGDKLDQNKIQRQCLSGSLTQKFPTCCVTIHHPY